MTKSLARMSASWATRPAAGAGMKVSNGVRRETGKELMVRVHYDEGVAIHIGPEFMRGRS